MTDYERGVNHASIIYQEVINDYVAENTKLRELCKDMNKVAHMLCEAWEGSCSKEAEVMSLHAVCPIGDTSELCVFGKLHDRMRELGIGDSND